MQPDEKYINDLDYLAQQGFDKVSVTDADLNGLVKQVRSKTFSYNSGLYFAFISLMMGIFIGASLFFVFDTNAITYLPVKQLPVITDTLATQTLPLAHPVPLVEVAPVKDNFIDPNVKALEAINVSSKNSPLQYTDSIITIPEKPVDARLFNKGNVQEAKLKFIANAPVIYIHDLKVTDYTTLYFKKNHFVEFTGRPGTSADYSSKNNAGQNASHIKQSPDYFLHEELAEALLYFKKGSFDACINLLNVVANYNDNDINCSFYLAMSYYYKHNYTKAISLFDVCIENLNNTFLQEAMFYKALSLYESGDKTEAITAFKTIAEEEGFYAEKAKGYLK